MIEWRLFEVKKLVNVSTWMGDHLMGRTSINKCPYSSIAGRRFLAWCKQTWKKAWTRGHCPRKFLRIVEISGLWKIDYSYFGIKLMNCEQIFFNIKYLAYL